MKKYTRKIIKQYVAERETTPSNDTIMSYPYFLENIIEQVYKDALAEGRECLKNWKNMACFVEWHDLRKDSKDLPKTEDFVISQDGIICWYDIDTKQWLDWEGTGIKIVLWCEIPTFKK